MPSYAERRQIVEVRKGAIGSGGDSSGMDDADERLRAKIGRSIAVARPMSPERPPRPSRAATATAEAQLSPPRSPLPPPAPVSPTPVHRAVKPKRRKPMRIVDIDAGVAPSTTVAESEAALSDHDVAPPQSSHTRSISHGSPG